MNESGALLAIIGFIVGGIILVLAITVDWSSRTVKPIRAKRHTRITRQQQLWVLVGLGIGVAMFIISGWIVYLVAAPIAGFFLPVVLSKGDSPQKIDRLDALETWTRSLSGLTITGSAGLEQHLIASLPSTPESIRPQVNSLVARLNARWPTREALEAFARDFDDPTADLVIMHLLLKEQSHGPGLAKALEDLAEIMGDEVRTRRQIETDRAKPRTQIRIVSVALIAVLAVLPFLGTYTAAYDTPIGQMVLAFWLIMFAGLLWWMRKIATVKPAPRLLVAPEGENLS